MINIASLSITADILGLISQIDEFKGAWRATSILTPERLSALRHVATIESIGSSTRIEGSKLSNADIEKLLSNLKIHTFDTRDEEEVAGYADTMELVFQSWEEITLTENHIKQLHRDLLQHSTKDDYHRGQYKTTSNSVAAFDEQGKQLGIIFETATPFDTPQLMQELLSFTREQLEKNKLHPLLIISIFVVVFLEIHPFQDGNGRLSRVLTTLLLLRSGYTYVPYSSLESVIEENKEGYYLALRQTQGAIRSKTPNWQPWVTFFLKSLQKQKYNLAKKIETEKLLLETLPELSLKILEHVNHHGRVTIGEMVSLTGKSRNTLKEHFRLLTQKQFLKPYSSGRGAWYGRG